MTGTDCILDAKLLIDEVNDLLVNEDVDTIGGWFLSQNIDTIVGSEIEAEGHIFRVLELDGHQLKYLEVVKI